MPETISRLPVQDAQRYEPLRAQRDPLAEGSGRPRTDRADRGRWRKQSWLGRFVSTYGWRAYAIPMLVALTVFVGYQTVTNKSGAQNAESGTHQPIADPASVGASIIGAPPKGLSQFDASLPTGVLPDGEPFSQTGNKTWHVVPGTTDKVGTGTYRTFNYTIEVEDGVDTMGFGGDETFARMVTQTLSSPKSWTKDPKFAFVRIDSGTPDFRISLTSSDTVREGCGYEIQLESSCYNPAYNGNESRVFINEARWVRGAVPFQGDITSYRQYLINHEVGHAIGYRAHEPCEQDGSLAPVMMQQTFSVNNNDASKFEDNNQIHPDGKVCKTNPWPFPIP